MEKFAVVDAEAVRMMEEMLPQYIWIGLQGCDVEQCRGKPLLIVTDTPLHWLHEETLWRHLRLSYAEIVAHYIRESQSDLFHQRLVMVGCKQACLEMYPDLYPYLYEIKERAGRTVATPTALCRSVAVSQLSQSATHETHETPATPTAARLSHLSQVSQGATVETRETVETATAPTAAAEMPTRPISPYDDGIISFRTWEAEEAYFNGVFDAA